MEQNLTMCSIQLVPASISLFKKRLESRDFDDNDLHLLCACEVYILGVPEQG